MWRVKLKGREVLCECIEDAKALLTYMRRLNNDDGYIWKVRL